VVRPRNMTNGSVTDISSAAGDRADFFAGGGEMGALMRAKEWSKTPLGPPELWPQSLKTCVRIVLTSRQPMFVWWGDELINLYNDAYRTIVGGKHPDALGQPASVVWREIWDQVGPRARAAMQGNVGTYDEALLLIMERNGYREETYYTFSYSPVPNDEHGIGGIICANTDDTQRIIGERQLTLLRELAAGIPDARSVEEACELGARALATNPRDLPFALIYLADPDRRRATLAGASGVVAGEDAAPVEISLDAPALWPLARALAGGETELVDLAALPVALPTGAWDTPPAHAALLPIAPPGHAGRVGVLVAGLNPHRLFDDSYRRLLALVAGQFSAGIANAQAYEEERRRAEALAEIDRAKTTFFSNASHEFRTPLTLMLSPLEDMLVRNPTARTVVSERGEIELIHRNGLRLLKLVNTLLDFSRIEAGRLQAAYEPVDLAVLTAELASTFRSAMERARLRFRVDCPALPLPVHIDRDMWEKIVLNLVSNAFKYTLEGEVSVSLHPAADGSGVELRVRDTGVGIPDAELPRLFERFHRIEGQRGRTQEGTGIGLALVQELVRLHGGTVRVESAQDRGSCFTVLIPNGTAHLPPERVRAARSSPVSGGTAEAFIEEALRWLPGDASDAVPLGGAELPGLGARPLLGEGRTVLLADDNADMRDYVQRLLSPRYTVEAVSDGQSALEAARRRRPDLILSDIMMPRLDGIGLLRELRGDIELRDVPVILLSARAGEEASVEGLEAGADDYLTKPFSARELLARVGANLDLAALRRDALRVENELRRQAQLAQERAEGILTSINDGFFTLDRDWRLTYVNAAALRMMGRAAEDLIDRNYWDVFPPAVGSAVETYYRRAMLERVDVAFEHYYAPWRRWFDIRAYPARGDGISVYFQDITGRKQAEDALRRLNETLEVQVTQRTAELQAKEARLRTIFETSYTYQGLMALDGTLLDANATSLRGIAATLRDVIGKPFWDTPWFTGTPGMSETVLAAVRKVAGGETVRQEIHVNLPVGGWRWFDFEMRPVRDGQGKVVAITPEAIEITGRRQAEEALRQAQKMEAIGQLTGGVAHDFNNLLQVIIGNLDALRRRSTEAQAFPFSTDVRRLAEGAIRGAERAASLTQQLLAFSRRQPLDPRPTDINKLIVGMSDLLRRSLGETIAIETVTAGGLWRVSVDGNQLESAILNLAVNARDAMPEGGKLTVETVNAFLDDAYAKAHEDVATGQYVLIAVSDTGTGMTKDVIAKAFDPFFTTKDIGRGTGLGLSQIYGFVKQSGGHIKIYSEPGEGTTVKLYLPRLLGDASVSESRSDVAAVPRSRAGELVLVVEDDQDVRAATGEMLAELGYGVVVATDGNTALRVLEERRDIRLLFTDVGLPGGMNGRQLAEVVRARHPNLPVLFTTGYARNAIVHHGRLDPGIDLLVKPFTYAGLANKLRQVL